MDDSDLTRYSHFQDLKPWHVHGSTNNKSSDRKKESDPGKSELDIP